MTSRGNASPTAGKRRPALATLQHGVTATATTQRRSSIAKPANLETPSDVAGQSPAQKKPRRSASKRVSFGGEHIKLFNNEHETEWGESPPFVFEPRSQDLSTTSPPRTTGAGASPVAPRARDSPRRRNSPAPSPRRSPRLSNAAREESNDDAGGDDGDTLTLPHMSEMIQDQAGTPPRLSRSPLFMDEDVTPGAAAPRLSVAGGCGDDTTVVVPIPAPVESLNGESGDGKVRHRRESMQSNLSDGDITQQIPRMNGLLDIDEAYDGASDGGIRESPSNKSTSSPFANIDEVTQSVGDNDSTVGNVTSEAAPLVSLLAEDAGNVDFPQEKLSNNAGQSPGNALSFDGPSPTCSSPGTSGRASIGDITLGIPQVGALLSMDEPSSPAVTESNAVARPVLGSASLTPPRPVLPESRQLFSSEMQGDDTTIHYHDTNPQIGDVQLSLPVASDGRSSPSRANARSTSKDDGQLDQEPSESASNAQPSSPAPTLQPQIDSDDVLQPSGLCETDTCAVENETSVITNFLEGVNVQFRDVDFKALQRGASLGFGLDRRESDGEETDNTEDSKRAALFKRVYSAARSSVILKRLNKAVKDMQEEVASRQSRVAELSAKISRDPPKYFERVIDSEKLKQSELSKMQLEFKRLRKASAMQAKREHATIRSEREQRIGEQECHQIATLQSDQGLLESNTEVFTSEVRHVDASVNEHQLQAFVDQVAGMETDLAVTQTLRSEVRSRVAALADTKECIENAVSKRENIASEISSLSTRNEELKSEVSRLQDYAKASSGHELKKLLEQHRDEHSLLSRVTGVRALVLSDSEVRVRILGILDVHFEIQGSAVASTRCSASPRNMPGDAECPFESFVARAVSSVGERCLKNTAVVHDIPVALQRCVAFLSRVLNVHRGLAQYQRTREVSYERSKESSASSPAAEVTMRAEYYSLTKHCKFDVVISVLATAPARELADALAGEIEIQVDDVDAIIGTCPDKATVCDVVRSATTGRSHSAVLDALESIWTLLD